MTHGFLGYKDYGMFPYTAQQFAEAGFVTHRYNLSHSGMTNVTDTFERPDLFEYDTWMSQVADIETVLNAVSSGEIAGKGLPVVLWGHSRGGVSSLLMAGKQFANAAEARSSSPLLAGVMTLAAPSETNRMPPEAKEQMREQGFFEVKSNRTGQMLRISRTWLDEQDAQPEAHDVLKQASHITCPALIMHGQADPTVPVECAIRIMDAINSEADGQATARIIEGGNHVMNTQNPMNRDEDPSPQLQEAIQTAIVFAEDCTKG